MAAGINRTRSRTNAVPASSGLGNNVTEASVAGTSGRGLAGTKEWTPTVANLFVIVVLEVVAFALLRYVINRVV
jgi:hypothetical protein